MPDRQEPPEDMREILELETSRRRWPRRVIILALLLALVGGGWWYLRPSSGATSAVGFRTAQVTKGDLEVIVSATGTLEPVNQVDVGSEVSGTIRTVKVDFNDMVKKGQVLAVLDTTKLEAQRDEARASVALAQAQLANAQAAAREAKVDLERMEKAYKLSKGRLPSAQDLDAAVAANDKAEAQVGVYRATVNKARSSLKAYESDLGKAIIVAPIDGMILDRQVEPGQTVAASLSAPVLFTMAENLTSMELNVAVDEADVGQVKEGQRATFVVDAYPDKRFPARITQVRFAPQDDDGVVTYECILAVDNSALLLRPGMTCTADIVTNEVRDAVLVPNLALRFTPTLPQEPQADAKDDRGFLAKIMPGPPRRLMRKNGAPQAKAKNQRQVWVLEEGRPVAKLVTTGASDGSKTQVVKGEVSPGQKVLVGQEAAKP